MDDDALSLVLKAAGDVTRRRLLTALVQEGPTRVTDLAARFDMSLNGISKHIKVLEAAGLVDRRTHGREHLIEANLSPIRQMEAWFAALKSIWDLRIDALEQLLNEEDQNHD